MMCQLDARYQTLSRKLNAISGRSIDHISQMCAKRIKSPYEVMKEGDRGSHTNLYLAIRESGKLFMVADDGEITKVYDEPLSDYQSSFFNRLEREKPVNGPRYYSQLTNAVNGKTPKDQSTDLTKPMYTYTCQTANPYVSVYWVYEWVSRS